MIGTVRQVGYKFVVPPARPLPDSESEAEVEATTGAV